MPFNSDALPVRQYCGSAREKKLRGRLEELRVWNSANTWPLVRMAGRHVSFDTRGVIVHSLLDATKITPSINANS